MVFRMKRHTALMATIVTATLTLFSSMTIVAPKATAIPRRPISVPDTTATDASFARFSARLQTAIRDRDSQYLKSILPADGIAIGYGRPTKIADLKLENPDSDFCGILAYTTRPGCGRSLVNSKDWLCSTVGQNFMQQYPQPAKVDPFVYATRSVIVLGQNVNVRSQPNLNSPVIAQLTNEVVNRNPNNKDIFDRNPQRGWAAIVLNNNKVGYVSSRYAYFPWGYTLLISKVNQQWQITQVLAGE
jgi:hypothetical protein